MISACSVWPEEKDQEGRPFAPVAPLLYGKCHMHNENRVQWFWHFFRNPICFMCFWFGLEILRLVYRKGYLKYWMVSILFDLLSSKKSHFAEFKNVQKSRVWQKEKKFLQKKFIFKDLENLAKNHFSEKNFLGTPWRKSSSHFWNQRKIPLFFDTLCAQFEEVFFQLL